MKRDFRRTNACSRRSSRFLRIALSLLGLDLTPNPITYIYGQRLLMIYFAEDFDDYVFLAGNFVANPISDSRIIQVEFEWNRSFKHYSIVVN